MESSTNAVVFGLSQVATAWPVVAAAALLGLALGYAYLLAVNKFARPVVNVAIFLAVTIPLLCGLAGMYGAYQTDIHSHAEAIIARYNVTADMSKPWVPSTGDQTHDVVVSSSLLLVGLLLACLACCARRKIEMVIGSIEATCDCLWECPGLLTLPLVFVILRVITLVACFAGFCWVLACGQVQKSDITDSVPSGLLRTFTYTDDEKMMMAGYIFVAAWIIEIGKAFEQWIYAYATQMWFFNRGKVSCFAIPRAMVVGVVYHLGTLAFGAVLLALFQVAYYLLSLAYSKAKETARDETSNKVVGGIAACCCCCLQCWEKLIRFMNKNTYLVVAITSDDFCSATQKSVSIVASEFAAIGVLEGATVVFQICGVASITGLGTVLSWLLATRHEAFAHPSSKYFTASPEYVTVAAGLVCVTISWTFMTVFDTVSDAILFCWAYDRKFRKDEGWPPKEDLPDRLKKILPESERDPLLTKR